MRLCPGLGEVRAAPAFAAYFLRHFANNLAGLHTGSEIFGDADDQRDVPVGRRAKHDHARADLVAQLIDQRAQLRAFKVIDSMGEHFHALHFFYLFAGIRGGRGSRLHPGVVEFAREALDLRVFPVKFGLQ